MGEIGRNLLKRLGQLPELRHQAITRAVVTLGYGLHSALLMLFWEDAVSSSQSASTLAACAVACVWATATLLYAWTSTAAAIFRLAPVDLASITAILFLNPGTGGAILLYTWFVIDYGLRGALKTTCIGFIVALLALATAVFTADAGTQRLDPTLTGCAVLILLIGYLVLSPRSLAKSKASDDSSQRVSPERAPIWAEINAQTHLIALLNNELASTQQAKLRHLLAASHQRLTCLLEPAFHKPTHHSSEAAFDVLCLIHDTVGLYQQSAQAQHSTLAVQVDPSLPTEVLGSIDTTRMLMMTLLSNAVTATEAGKITLAVSAFATTDDTSTGIKFEVSDTGTGILPDIQKHLLADFALAKPTETLGNRGLGIRVAKLVIDAMQGQIGFESNTSGSRFWFKLEYRTITTALQTEPSKPATMLLVGEQNFTQDCQQLLAQWNLPTEFSRNPAAALTQLADSSVNVSAVVADERVLGNNIASFAERCRVLTEPREIPIVLVRQHAHLINQTGLDNYTSVLNWPIVPSLLFAAVSHQQLDQATKNVVSLVEHKVQLFPASNQVLVVCQSDTLRKLIEQVFNKTKLKVRGLALAERTASMQRELMQSQLVITDSETLLSELSFPKSLPSILVSTAVSVQKPLPNRRHINLPLQVEALLDAAQQLLGPAASSQPNPSVATESPLSNLPVLLDATKLENLSYLGTSPEFVDDLIEGFLRDGRRLLGKLHLSVSESDYAGMRDNLNALTSSASELGVIRLTAACKKAQNLKPFDMRSTAPAAALEDIVRTFDSSAKALLDYIARKQKTRS